MSDLINLYDVILTTEEGKDGLHYYISEDEMSEIIQAVESHYNLHITSDKHRRLLVGLLKKLRSMDNYCSCPDMFTTEVVDI